MKKLGIEDYTAEVKVGKNVTKEDIMRLAEEKRARAEGREPDYSKVEEEVKDLEVFKEDKPAPKEKVEELPDSEIPEEFEMQEEKDEVETGEMKVTLLADRSKTWTDLMIDIETLGTKPGSVILSIGAVPFNLESWEVAEMQEGFHQKISIASSLIRGFNIEQGTLDWWRQQDTNATREAFDTLGYDGQPDSISEVLGSLSDFVNSISEKFDDGKCKIRVWGNGPTFDIAHLEKAYEMVEMKDLVPWSYNRARDVRTILDLAKTISGFDHRDEEFIGTPHIALDDAYNEALNVVKAYKRLEGDRNQSGLPDEEVENTRS